MRLGVLTPEVLHPSLLSPKCKLVGEPLHVMGSLLRSAPSDLHMVPTPDEARAAAHQYWHMGMPHTELVDCSSIVLIWGWHAEQPPLEPGEAAAVTQQMLLLVALRPHPDHCLIRRVRD